MPAPAPRAKAAAMGPAWGPESESPAFSLGSSRTTRRPVGERASVIGATAACRWARGIDLVRRPDLEPELAPELGDIKAAPRGHARLVVFEILDERVDLLATARRADRLPWALPGEGGDPNVGPFGVMACLEPEHQLLDFW